MGRRKIKIRKHNRHLSSGITTSVRQHSRQIDGRISLHDNPDRDKKKHGRGWQKTQVAGKGDIALNIEGAEKKDRKTISVYYLTQHLSRTTYQKAPKFKDVMKTGQFVGLVAVPREIKEPKDNFSMKDQYDLKFLPRGFDRKPASSVEGEDIDVKKTDGYNPLRYTATRDDVYLSPVIDEDIALSSGDARIALNHELSKYMAWIKSDGGKIKGEVNANFDRQWGHNVKEPRYAFITRDLDKRIASNAGQIGLDGYVRIVPTGDKYQHEGKMITEYKLDISTEQDIKPISGEKKRAEKGRFRYRYPTVFAFNNPHSDKWRHDGRAEQKRRQKDANKERFNKAHNDWEEDYRKFERKLDKDLRAEIHAIKQMQYPIETWEASDYELYRQLVKTRSGVDLVDQEGLGAPPDPVDYNLRKHKRRP